MKGCIGPRQRRRYHGHGTGGAPNPAVWHPCDLDGTQQFGWDSEGGRSTWEHSEHGGDKAREGATHRRGSMANGSGLELVGAVCMPRRTERP